MFLFWILSLLTFVVATRYEGAYRFRTRVDGSQVTGMASQQSTMSTTVGTNSFCFGSSETGPTTAVVYKSSFTLGSGTGFTVAGNVTWGDSDRIFFESPQPGAFYAIGHLQYGNIPYVVTGGTGRYQGAQGSAAEIFVENGNDTIVLFYTLFYTDAVESDDDAGRLLSPVELESPVEFESQPACKKSTPVSSTKLCMTEFALDFLSTPVPPNKNAAVTRSSNWITSPGPETVHQSFGSDMAFYKSTTGTPMPGYFNESGAVSVGTHHPAPSSFQFHSTSDGKFGQRGGITYGSIAYRIPSSTKATGQFAGGEGVMIDIFQASSKSTPFPIRALGIIFNKC